MRRSASLIGLFAAVLAVGSCARPAGPATVTDDFASTAGWELYDSPGHAGNGLRRPAQVQASGGILTITGDAVGTTGGLQWHEQSQQYGQWDIRMRAAPGCTCYHPVVLLWAVGGGSGVNNAFGEIDIVEAFQRPKRDGNTFSLHYGDGSDVVSADTTVDMTQWHVYHLVWRADYLATWIDDNPAYFATTRAEILPRAPVDLAIQLDWFPQEGTTGGPAGSMQVDRVTQSASPITAPPTT